MRTNEEMHIVLHLYCSASFGGAERRLLRTYGDLARKTKVDLIIRERASGIFLESCNLSGISLKEFNSIRIIKSRFNFLTDFKALLCALSKRYTNHVFFDYSRYNAIAIGLISKLTDAAIVFTSANCVYGCQGELLGSDDGSEGFKRLIRSSSWIDVLYPNQLPLFESITGHKNVSITPGTFTDLDLCRPSEKRRKIVFLSARLDAVKNPKLLIDAVEECKNELKDNDYEVYICGTGPNYDVYRDLINQKGLSEIIYMPGYVQSNEMLSDAEIVCVLSEKENYPSQVIAEGCACGCYIVATDVGNTAAIIEDGFGVLVNCNPKAVSRAINHYIQLSKEEKDTIIDNARQYAVEHFQKRATAEYFLRINMLAHGSRR